MKPLHLLSATIAFTLAVLLPAQAAAQYGPRVPAQRGPGYRPGLSPYLNLLRGGDASSNYYLGVRPEIQRRDDRAQTLSRTQTLDSRTQELRSNIRDLEDREDRVVSTGADFGDTRGYFDPPGTYYPRVAPGIGRASASRGRGR